jgi:hypothetical protein
MLALQSRAIDHSSKAVKADRAGERRRAFFHYKESLVHLMEWLKLEKAATARDALKAKIHGYMTRAEELKILLNMGYGARRTTSEVECSSSPITTRADTMTEFLCANRNQKRDECEGCDSQEASFLEGPFTMNFEAEDTLRRPNERMSLSEDDTKKENKF